MIDLDALKALMEKATPDHWDYSRPIYSVSVTINERELLNAIRNAAPALIAELVAARECVPLLREFAKHSQRSIDALAAYDAAIEGEKRE